MLSSSPKRDCQRAFGRFFQNHHRPHMFRPFQYEPNTKRGAIMEAMKLLLTAVCSVTVCGSVFAAPPPPPHYYRNDGVALAAGIVGVVRSAIAPVVYTVAPPPPPPVYYAYPPPPPPPYPFYGYPPPPPAWGPGPRVTTFRHRRLRRVITEAAGKAESRQTETDPPGFFCFK